MYDTDLVSTLNRNKKSSEYAAPAAAKEFPLWEWEHRSEFHDQSLPYALVSPSNQSLCTVPKPS